MKIFCWNSHGLKNLRGFRTLRNLIKKEDLDFVIFQKTKVKSSFFSIKKFSFDFKNCLGVDCEGKSRRLAVLWKEGVHFEVLNYSSHHVHGTITSLADGALKLPKWVLAGVYGYSKVS